MANVRVTKNIYGNFRGYLTGQLTVELGASEFDAKFWMAKVLHKHEDAKVLPSSYFSLNEINAFEQRLRK